MLQTFKDFQTGFVLYPTLELLARGRSHWTMALAGGLGMVWLRRVQRRHGHKTLALQALRGALGITAIEYAIGRRFNRRYRIWDYRRMPLNLHGQVCLPYTLAWCGLSAVVLAAMRAHN